ARGEQLGSGQGVPGKVGVARSQAPLWAGGLEPAALPPARVHRGHRASEKGDGVRPLFLASALAARRRLSAAERVCKSSRARGTRAEIRQGESWRSATRPGPGAGGAGGKGKSLAGSGVLPQRLSHAPSGRTRALVAGDPAARG